MRSWSVAAGRTDRARLLPAAVVALCFARQCVREGLAAVAAETSRECVSPRCACATPAIVSLGAGETLLSQQQAC